MRGKEGGVDTPATLHLLQRGKLPAAQQGALRTAMMGGTFGNATAHRRGQQGQACPHCGDARETTWHRVWQCPRWETQRVQALGSLTAEAV